MSSDRDAPLIDCPPGRMNAFHVDLDALDHNVDEIRRMVGPEVLIFAALKANAYGFGVVEIAHAVLKSGADGLAVVDLRDTVLLRNAGIDAPIHLFGGILITAEVARYISDFDLMPTILRIEDATAVSPSRHKIDTRLHQGRSGSRTIWHRSRGRAGVRENRQVDAQHRTVRSQHTSPCASSRCQRGSAVLAAGNSNVSKTRFARSNPMVSSSRSKWRHQADRSA